VLVGFDKSDDAGVFLLTPECALVQTVDFFTPIVDDPYVFGAITAANSLSDVYAMGGVPLTALSILAWPRDGSTEDLGQVILGGSDKMREAGCAILGGHSVADDEPKFGYSITGTVSPARVLSNAGARPGDALVLTKAIGTGVIATAWKRGQAPVKHMDTAIVSMMTLNNAACQAMLATSAHACTDITGFGLLGHAREIAAASGVTLRIDASAVPLLPGAYDHASAGAIAAGLNNNREFISCAVESSAGVDAVIETLFYDPQTSGGLLISLPEQDVDTLVSLYPPARKIGVVVERQATLLQLV
jgi:selenide,water dikinase